MIFGGFADYWKLGGINKEGVMNLPNMKQLYAPVAFVAVILGGCATPQPIPELSQPQSAGFGIDVTLKLPVGIFSAQPEQVFFVKVDDKDGLLQRQGFRSNYSKDGRAYFLNAPPGTFVAIGAYFSRQIQSYGMPPKTGYTTYFAKELVEHTKVTVREGDFSFMGSYVVDMSVGLQGADEVQTHYKNAVAPGSPTGTFLMGYMGDIHYRGTMRERTNDEQARNDFFRNAKDDLAGSAWATRIK